jgi:glycine/D-amino acid oxidase-like deaminating enzyme
VTDRCEIVVVGGGIMGASLALHLLEAGAGSVRLLERDGLFEGTSGAGGGFLAPWTVMNPMHGSESPTLPVELYSMRFYAELAAAGYDIDYRNNGVLWTAASESAWEQLAMSSWKPADPGGETVDPERIAELTGGLVAAEGVAGGQWAPSGAQVYTAKVGVALARRITELGGVIDTRRPITGITVTGGRVTGVDTPTGPVHCDHVAVAAGAWNNQLLAPLGVFLAGVPQVTSRIITEPIGIPETLPVLMLQGIMPDEPGGGTMLWVRAHEGGLLWGGMYTGFPRDVLVDAPIPDRLDELPTDGVVENLRVAKAATFMPSLSRPASIRVKHGVPCYTPDDLALIGAVPGIDGLYALGGDNELGFTHGPGFGKALAEHIVLGHTDLVDLAAFRIDRFGDRYTNDTETLAGVAEQFGALLAGGELAVAGDSR